jgi:eukaryotic-like serine/threonine-protein kinase
MRSERLKQIDELYRAALNLAPEERRAFIEKGCAADPELLREVESRLAAHGQAVNPRKSLTSEVAIKILTESNRAFSLAGRSIGQYTNLSPIGAGGMGEVYVATDKMGRKVALKLLTARLSTDQRGVARFMREAQALLSLNHPNIVTVFDIGKVDFFHYIASELIEGQSLRQQLKVSGVIEVAEALNISIQVASALAAAHEKGIIHRDIKPENVMIRSDGYVKVVDFGVAKLIEEEKPDAEATDIATQLMVKTSEGIAIGSIHYMSPEQARGQPVDGRTDTWSLGVVLYEMLTGRRPFDGETVADVLSSVLERQPSPLLRFSSDIPETLEWIVNKSLRKNKNERYQTPVELLTDLKELQKRLEFAAEQERTGTPKRIVDAVSVTEAEGGHGATTGKSAERTANGQVNSISSAEYVFNEFRKHKRGLLLALVTLVLAVAAVTYFYVSKSDGKTIDSIAVLPLLNASGDPDVEYLSDGISETLINSLSRISSLRVMARSTVFRYKGRDTDPQNVGRELGVDAVLTGRVVQRGENLTVQADLINVSDGSQLWGEQYNRKLSELVALQGEIARDVSQKLRSRLSGADEQKISKDYTANVEAYRLYLKGRYHIFKLTPPEVYQGISYFNQAIDLDPSYALAYAGISDAYRSLALGGEMLPAEFFPKAKAASQKALQIDETLAEAHISLGVNIFWYDWDWNAAEKQYKRALELNPNNGDAHLFYAHLLSNTGQHREAIAEVNRAKQLDPLSPFINALEGQFLIHAGRVDEAIASLQKTIELEPNFWPPHLFASSAYISKEMYPEAIAAADKSRKLSEFQTISLAFGSYALAKSGKGAEARALLDELLKTSTERFVPPYHIALIYNGLGEPNESYVWLERGFEQRDPKMAFLKVDPKWNNLRGDPRFQDLMRRVGF